MIFTFTLESSDDPVKLRAFSEFVEKIADISAKSLLVPENTALTDVAASEPPEVLYDTKTHGIRRNSIGCATDGTPILPPPYRIQLFQKRDNQYVPLETQDSLRNHEEPLSDGASSQNVEPGEPFNALRDDQAEGCSISDNVVPAASAILEVTFPDGGFAKGASSQCIGRGGQSENYLISTEFRSNSDILDESGLPWDERLHSRTKSRTTEGLWRRQRGLSPSKANKLETEIRTLLKQETLKSSISVPNAALPSSENIPGPAAIQTAPPPPPPPVVDNSYLTLVKKITAAVETEKLSYEQVKDILMQFGIPDLSALKNVPHLMPVIEQQVKELINA